MISCPGSSFQLGQRGTEGYLAPCLPRYLDPIVSTKPLIDRAHLLMGSLDPRLIVLRRFLDRFEARQLRIDRRTCFVGHERNFRPDRHSGQFSFCPLGHKKSLNSSIRLHRLHNPTVNGVVNFPASRDNATVRSDDGSRLRHYNRST